LHRREAIDVDTWISCAYILAIPISQGRLPNDTRSLALAVHLCKAGLDARSSLMAYEYAKDYNVES
jgi:hypothetical protein